MMPLTHWLGYGALEEAVPGWGLEDEREELRLTYFVVSICLVCFAGLMSGLTLGLMSLDHVDLEILRRSGSPHQQRLAEAIMPVLRRPHRLLVTLLVCNAAAAEALPLFLNQLTDPVTAVIMSVTVVLLFGEIIPQAACSAYGLQIGAYSAPFVQALIRLTFPVSYPIGWVLDRVLGKRHTALFRRAELKALVDIHTEGQKFGGQLTADEVNIIKGALDLTHKTAKTAMTPLDMVFMLPADARLDEGTLMSVLASGHSRIPVHRPGDRGQILGILLVKELILVDKDVGRTVGNFKTRSLPYLLAGEGLRASASKRACCDRGQGDLLAGEGRWLRGGGPGGDGMTLPGGARGQGVGADERSEASPGGVGTTRPSTTCSSSLRSGGRTWRCWCS